MQDTFFKNLVYILPLLLFLAVAIMLTGTATAQVGAGPSTDTIALSQSPNYPGPNEDVTISVTSRLINIQNRQIVWEQDGEVIAAGAGVTEITVTTGEADQSSVINFRVIIDGTVVQRELVIRPADVNLIWEAERSYTPPFYQGKSLHPGWGPVKVTAMPQLYRSDGTKYSASELIYTWSYNGLVYGDDSGRGKTSFSVSAVPRQGNAVAVEIETPGGDLISRESITIPIYEPEVVLYPRSALLGTRFETALSGNYRLNNLQEIEITAHPYFFLTDSATDPNLSYNWRMNRETLIPPEQKNTVRLRRPENVSGEADLSVEVDDTSRIFTEQSSDVTIEF